MGHSPGNINQRMYLHTIWRSIMHFKVTAGNMFCGMLYVTPAYHTFRDRDGKVSDAIYSYTRLKLTRCKHA